MDIVIPKVGSKGTFTLKSPFDSIVEADQEYEVLSVRSISELQNVIDVFKIVYETIGLSNDIYLSDVTNKVPIVTLLNNANKQIHVPANKIGSQPISAGVKYQGKAIVLNMGPLPTDYDFTQLESQLVNISSDVVGVKPKVTYSPTTAITIIEYSKDELYRTKLNNAKKVTPSEHQKIKELEAEIERLNIYNNDLEEYIIKVKNGLITP